MLLLARLPDIQPLTADNDCDVKSADVKSRLTPRYINIHRTQI